MFQIVFATSSEVLSLVGAKDVLAESVRNKLTGEIGRGERDIEVSETCIEIERTREEKKLKIDNIGM